MTYVAYLLTIYSIWLVLLELVFVWHIIKGFVFLLFLERTALFSAYINYSLSLKKNYGRMCYLIGNDIVGLAEKLKITISLEKREIYKY